jgi:hypothetical protein
VVQDNGPRFDDGAQGVPVAFEVRDQDLDAAARGPVMDRAMQAANTDAPLSSRSSRFTEVMTQ